MHRLCWIRIHTHDDRSRATCRVKSRTKNINYIILSNKSIRSHNKMRKKITKYLHQSKRVWRRNHFFIILKISIFLKIEKIYLAEWRTLLNGIWTHQYDNNTIHVYCVLFFLPLCVLCTVYRLYTMNNTFFCHFFYIKKYVLFLLQSIIFII